MRRVTGKKEAVEATFAEPTPEISHPNLLALRKNIVTFATELARRMHVYCDPITLNPSKHSKEGLYGAYSGHARSLNWDIMMSTGPKAGYMVTSLDPSPKNLRGSEQGECKPCSNIKLEGNICSLALQEVGYSFGALFAGLAADDKNLNDPNEITDPSNPDGAKLPSDPDRRNSFRRWAIGSLENLQRLAIAAERQLPGGDQTQDAMTTLSDALNSAVSPFVAEEKKLDDIKKAPGAKRIDEIEMPAPAPRGTITYSPTPSFSGPSVNGSELSSSAAASLDSSAAPSDAVVRPPSLNGHGH